MKHLTWKAAEVEMEILTLQNDIHLKAHQGSPHFWCLVDSEKYKSVHTAALKVACHSSVFSFLWYEF